MSVAKGTDVERQADERRCHGGPQRRARGDVDARAFDRFACVACGLQPLACVASRTRGDASDEVPEDTNSQ